MRYVKRFDESTGKSYAYLDLEGITIPNIDQEHLEPLLRFDVGTYVAMGTSASEAAWYVVFGIVHDFLDTLTKEEQVKYATLMVLMHYEIASKIGNELHIDGHVLVDLESKLSEMLAAFSTEINLAPKLIKFTEENIDIRNRPDAGERPQDSDDMTFHQAELVVVTAIAVLCKMLSPIFGVFIGCCRKGSDGSYKEIHCLTIMRDILANDFTAIANKLKHYICKVVDGALRKNITLSHGYNGYTLSLVMDQIYAQIITKRFVSVGLVDHEENNLIKYIHTCARQAANTQFKGTSFSETVNPIKDPTEGGTSGDKYDGNVSMLEAESQISEKTAELPILAKETVRQAKLKMTAQYELDLNVIDAAESYYLMNPIPLGVTNNYLLGCIFGDYVCGAKTIDLLDSADIATLTAIAQVYLVSQGYNDIAHLLSVISLQIPKITQNSSDIALKSAWRNSAEYRECDQKFQCQANEIRWDGALEKTIRDLTGDVKRYGTAPAIWDLMQTDSKNGDEYIAPEDLPRRICGLLLQLFP